MRPFGEFLEWGAEYAAKEINASGGIAGVPVKVVPVDTALDPQKGSVEMARIVKDSLVAMGPVPEPVIMAAMPIAVEAGMMSITATTSLEYAQKFFPWTVSWFPANAGQASAARGGVGEGVHRHEAGGPVRRAVRPLARHGRRRM